MIDMAQADKILRTNKQAAEKIYSIINESTGQIISMHKYHAEAIRAVIRASIDTHMIVCEHQI